LEGFGIPVLEAMRFRCKVFSSCYSSLPEVCGPHATYWNDYSPKTMAATIKDALVTWRKDSQEADDAKAYSETFNYQHYTEQYITLYRQLLTKGL
ncbi:MAG: glycosyltransferase family 1 protein, partial [Prevotella sp.]|nr:glycosyltransferase family 1 protein [Prevotella sp.]